ncbi:hypothetical protein DMN91_002550 [Ooceraea biroi]|uniref:Nuclear envelope membrane protein n=1 Tax=Ooceraea biroi TaxID=2015173 RepID=A0A026W4U9_OOCBI|nr:nurim homolog [Ooceraea biroi]XP_011343957.1 nurim homolog [Ooceraea biroi]XP_011343958.1 nurim homolog [Ooceraea biroi]XP_011343959.1 nurim homolog [Ooceraea biroi]XP_019888491.1 nurim homolog [Ooceraea biroi]EZA51058.1 Nurim-like protein [Ooceraea biroi]RLU24461.1 hypothetical protein DMN91_002550 [Ooceraea biroi]
MILNASSVIVCAFSFVYTCYILCSLTYFLSSHDNGDANPRVESGDNVAGSTLWSMLKDVSYLTIFVLQHSIMTNNFTERILRSLHIEHLDRSIYNACSSASLHLLISGWQQTPTALWKIDASNNLIWMLFSGVHVFAWSIIYSGCIMMDIAELSGVKQVWYATYGRISPLNAKSKELRRYMKHMRHPSFTGFLIILWIHPFMTIDRLLMATILTVYMALMWTIDSKDYDYHMRYFKQKQIELS